MMIELKVAKIYPGKSKLKFESPEELEIIRAKIQEIIPGAYIVFTHKQKEQKNGF